MCAGCGHSLNGLGVLGGSFDPVHCGHLAIAGHLRAHFGLASMALLPTATAHKGGFAASASQRLAMLQLAVAGTGLCVDARELARPAPCYSLDILRELRADLGPHRPLFFAMGMDAFCRIRSWHLWRQLPRLAHLVVVARPGHEYDGLWRSRLRSRARTFADRPQGFLAIMGAPLSELSATLVRRQLREGRSARLRHALPPAVLDYIQQQGLYGCRT